MPKYMVKNKYTYEKVRQTDHTYAPDTWTLSQNSVEGRFLYEEGDTIGSWTIRADTPVKADLSPEEASRFACVSGFWLAGKGTAAACRVTLWGEGGESFSTVGALCGTARLFSTAGMAFSPVYLSLEVSEGEADVTLSFGYVLNTLGVVGGQAHFYAVEGESRACALSDAQGAMVWTLGGESRLRSPVFPDSSDTVYNMKMPRRNTILLVLTNRSNAERLTLSFATTTHPWEDSGSLSVELLQDDRPHAYYFNLSALPAYCDGRLAQFALSAKGEGEIILHRYTFEQEKIIRTPLCEGIFCTADPVAMTITVRGRITDPDLLTRMGGGALCLYTTTMADERDTPSGKRRVAACPLPDGDGTFVMEGIPLRDECTTRLPYQFCLFAEGEGRDPVWLCDRFYIENYEAFESDPYAFDLPAYTVSATDFGAWGDAVHNDTDAIQAALDHVAAAGGGRVILQGSADFYGRRYMVTNLLLPSMVELHMEEGAVLWQSPCKEDYPYAVAYGHDGVIPGINWTHNLHVSNLPLLQSANTHHVKITGRGCIRMMDTGSEEGVGMPGYATGCPDRIHCIAIGFFAVDFCSCRGFEIIRANNYHTEFNHCTHVSLQDLRLHEVKCVSGDGFGVACAKHVFVNRCFFQSNDDGVVMSTHLHDPRGILWWTNYAQGEDNGCRHIKTVHSYLNSGGGKALAFITWGTNDPDQSLEEIDGVEAYDNLLCSVNPVGAWHDNPYNGKVPFDNTETDDYSPVKNVRIFGNRYEGNCTLGPIQATNVQTDCGVHSASAFRNGDFTLGGMANWTLYPNQCPDSVHAVIYADKQKGCIEHFDGGDVAAAQGLYLLPGEHRVEMELLTGGSGAEVFVSTLDGTRTIASSLCVCLRPTVVALPFSLCGFEGQDVLIGVRSPRAASGYDPTQDTEGYAVFDGCRLVSVTNEAEIARRAKAAFLSAMEETFVLTPAMTAASQNGKMMLAIPSAGKTTLLSAKEEGDTFSIEAAIRVDRYDVSRGQNGFGYRFSIRDDGKAYRELYFNESRKTLTLCDHTEDGVTTLYLRDHFFFTSNDFHIFRIEVGKTEVSVWIDGAQYAVIPCAGKAGGVAFVVTDADVAVMGGKCSLREQ